LQTLSTFKPGTNDWSIRNTGTASGETWRIYEGSATPILTYFLTPLSGAIDGTAITKTYNASTSAQGVINWAGTPNAALILGTPTVVTSSKNVGTYTTNTIGAVWSSQLGYDISVSGMAPSVTIDKADLTITGGMAQNKEYDGSNTASVTGSTVTAIGADVVTLSTASGATFSDKNAAITRTKPTTVTTAYTHTGTDADNYNLIQQSGLTATITAKNISAERDQDVRRHRQFDGLRDDKWSGGVRNPDLQRRDGQQQTRGDGGQVHQRHHAG
jgi:hypothetical protein